MFLDEVQDRHTAGSRSTHGRSSVAAEWSGRELGDVGIEIVEVRCHAVSREFENARTRS